MILCCAIRLAILILHRGLQMKILKNIQYLTIVCCAYSFNYHIGNNLRRLYSRYFKYGTVLYYYLVTKGLPNMLLFSFTIDGSEIVFAFFETVVEICETCAVLGTQ